jgi:thiol-disulfide isomerase/thioredoxin
MKNALLIVCIFIGTLNYAQDSIIELPFVVKNGFGPFTGSFAGISPYSKEESNQWDKTHLQIEGIPESWTEIKQGEIQTNPYQSVYQDYLVGNITKYFYEYVQKGWEWIPDTLNLSRKPLKCKIALAFGKDISGKFKMLVDANNNLDLDDDSIFTPLELDIDTKINWDSLIIKNAITVSYERFSGNKIIQEKTPLLICYFKKPTQFFYSFPQYATTKLDGEEIAICSDDFTKLSYKKTSLVLLDNNFGNEKRTKVENLISNGENITVNGITFKNKGVNLNRNVLILEKTTVPLKQSFSSQVGFKAFPFEGLNFKTKSKISLNDYKGKYLLIDFWAEWCGPCIKELPNLKLLYNKLDKSRIEFIGIVGESHAEGLEKLIHNYSITWPQILTDERNKIKDTYGVSGYPTSFLINPEGIIVAKNLRGKELERKINELIKIE